MERPPILAQRHVADTLITSGQTAIGADGHLVAQGRVGAEVSMETALRCAVQCMDNVLAVAAAGEPDDSGTSLRLIELRAFVASAPEFTDHHLVADAASQRALEVLGLDRGQHVRTTLGVAGLPGGSPVEIQATFVLDAVDA